MTSSVSGDSHDLIVDCGHGIYTIDTRFQRPGVVASHVLLQDTQAALIDVGTTSCVKSILHALDSLQIRPEAVSHIIITHVHLDHAGAAGFLMRHCPNASLIVHPRGARHMIDPGKLIAGATAVYGEAMMARLFGEIIAVDAERVVEAADGFMLDFAGRTLEFLDTPGHARHHFCVYDKVSNGFFTGDTFGLSYRAFDTQQGPFIVPTTTPIQFDPLAFHASIDRLMSYQPEQMYLTHFGRIPVTPQLADRLHEQIDLFVRLALQIKSEDNIKQEYLIELMLVALIERLRQHGCTLTVDEIKQGMDMDLQLNSQGLIYWLEHSGQ